MKNGVWLHTLIIVILSRLYLIVKITFQFLTVITVKNVHRYTAFWKNPLLMKSKAAASSLYIIRDTKK